MKIQTIYLSLILFGLIWQPQPLLVTNNAKVSFYSKTILEDIEASSQQGASALNIQTGEILFKVPNTSFQFKKKLMQEHFNENYMESHKYPFSEFKGKIKEPIQWPTDGQRTLRVDGVLTIHGVAKPYSTKVQVNISKGVLTANASFKVRVADHGIKIPTLVFKNIAEFVEVRIQASYLEKK